MAVGWPRAFEGLRSPSVTTSLEAMFSGVSHGCIEVSVSVHLSVKRAACQAGLAHVSDPPAPGHLDNRRGYLIGAEAWLELGPAGFPRRLAAVGV